VYEDARGQRRLKQGRVRTWTTGPRAASAGRTQDLIAAPTHCGAHRRTRLCLASSEIPRCNHAILVGREVAEARGSKRCPSHAIDAAWGQSRMLVRRPRPLIRPPCIACTVARVSCNFTNRLTSIHQQILGPDCPFGDVMDIEMASRHARRRRNPRCQQAIPPRSCDARPAAGYARCPPIKHQPPAGDIVCIARSLSNFAERRLSRHLVIGATVRHDGRAGARRGREEGRGLPLIVSLAH